MFTLQRTCAILIPTRNRSERLSETLDRLRSIGLGGVDLWVYDDASIDGECIRSAVETHWRGGRVIRGQERSGQATGRNVLLRACNREFAIMLDDDQYLLKLGGLAQHIVEHSTNPRRAVIYFKNIAKADGRLDVPAHIGPRELPSFMGGCVLFHVPSILAVGGYRDLFVYGYEETDLALRLWARGFHVWYDPTIVAEHNQFYSPEERRDFREYDYLYARNGVLFSALNLPWFMGLPVGLARSLKRALVHKRNFGTKALGIAAGICQTIITWNQRTPLSMKQAFRRQRFVRSTANSVSPKSAPTGPSLA